MTTTKSAADRGTTDPAHGGRGWTVARVLSITAILVILAIAGTILGLYYQWSRRSLPQLDGEVRLAGLHSQVAVRRGRWGVPYITADNRDDLFFAQGYVMAQDRLWQMDLLRRAAKGELAEILGKDRLEFDKRQRIYGYHRLAKTIVKDLPPDLVAALNAYARGVNAFIDQQRDNLPLEFHLLQYEPQPWEPADSIVIGKLQAQVLSSDYERDITRAYLRSKFDEKTINYLIPEYSPFDQIVVGADSGPAGAADPTRSPARTNQSHLRGRPDQEFFVALAQTVAIERKTFADLGLDTELPGSNNWVISGNKTTTGKPILANDPHLAHGIPSIWYQIELQTTDNHLHVAGVTFPGAPGVVIGHNDRIAWGVTNFHPDVQDLYIEEFNPQNPHQYKVGNDWREAEIISEPIKVRRSLVSPTTDQVANEVVVTRHGPILVDQNGQRMALRWTALDNVAELNAFFGIASAGNWEEYCNALSHYPGPAQNFIYADVDGNIGYYVAGNIPIRRTGDGSVPYSGAGDEGDWLSYIPFGDLPHVYNPPKGWVATANNRLVGSTDSKYFLGHEWAAPYRAMRINELIAAKDKLSIDDVRLIQADVYSIYDIQFGKLVKSILSNDPRRNQEGPSDLLKAIDAWDGYLKPESLQATIIAETRENLTDQIYRNKLGAEYSHFGWYNQATGVYLMLTEQPTSMLPPGDANYGDLIIRSYQLTLDRLTTKFGSDRSKWTWGETHKLVFQHPLGLGPLARVLNAEPLLMGGSGYTVNAYIAGREGGVSMRLIADLSDLDNSSQGITVGQSGQNGSANYKDQVSDWKQVNRHLFPFSDKAIEQETAHRLNLKR